MARGADEANWNRARALAEVIWATRLDGGKTALPPEFCQPYGNHRKTLTPEQSAENMENLMAAMGRIFGR